MHIGDTKISTRNSRVYSILWNSLSSLTHTVIKRLSKYMQSAETDPGLLQYLRWSPL